MSRQPQYFFRVQSTPFYRKNDSNSQDRITIVVFIIFDGYTFNAGRRELLTYNVAHCAQ